MTEFFGVFDVKSITALRTDGAIGERQFTTVQPKRAPGIDFRRGKFMCHLLPMFPGPDRPDCYSVALPSPGDGRDGLLRRLLAGLLRHPFQQILNRSHRHADGTAELD